MATADECETALHTLARRLAERDDPGKQYDRTLSCTLRDLDVIFVGHLADGQLTGITRAADADAQIRLELTSDDLLAMVAGTLNVGSAWASKRLKISAGVRDLMRLRTIF